MSEKRATERYEQIPIFSHLNEAEIGRLLRVTDEKNVAQGGIIFKPADPCDGLWVVLSGKVEIRRRGQNGEDTTVASLSNRSVFGEMALLADRPRSATAIVVDAARVLLVPKARFDELLEKGDLAAYKVIQALAKLVVERLKRTEDEFLATLKELGHEKQKSKLAELQAFRQKVFTEWSF